MDSQFSALPLISQMAFLQAPTQPPGLGGERPLVSAGSIGMDLVHWILSPDHWSSPTFCELALFSSLIVCPASEPGGATWAYPDSLFNIEYEIAAVGVLVFSHLEVPIRLCKAPRKVTVLRDS